MRGKEIKDLIFDKGAFGYKIDDVTNCLQDISEYVVFLEEKIAKNEKEMSDLRQKLDHYEKNEDSVKEIIISAQQFKKNVLSEAKEKADRILKEIEERKLAFDADMSEKTSQLMNEAREKSDGLMRETRYRVESETRRLKTMKKEVSDFKSKLLELYKAHLDIITKIPECDDDVLDKSHKFEKESPRVENNEIYDNGDDTTEKVENFVDDSIKQFKSDDRPMFKVTMTDGNNSIHLNDHIRTRFSELRFGENKN